MQNIWNQIQTFFSDMYSYVRAHVSIELMVYIGIAVLVLIIVYVANRLVKKRKAKKRLADLETEINDIRSNSLQYKFNKATAFAKVNDDITDRVKNLTPKYDICLKSIESCEDIYDKAEEFINRHRYKKSMKTMDELEGVIDDTRDRIRIVNSSLDRILARETEVREKSNAAKERFRNLKNIYSQNRAAYYTGASYVDDQIEDIENAFNTFEEWMFASEFNKAKEEIDKISAKTNELSAIVSDYPDLYSKAKLLLPQALNDVEIQVQDIEEKNIDISYLEADEKMDAIRNAIEDAIIKLDNGNMRKAESSLNTISDQILVLQDDISQEKRAFDEIHGDLESNFAAIDEIEVELEEIVNLYANIRDRFGLEDWTRRFENAKEQMDILKQQRAQIQEQLSKEDTLQVDVVHNYRRFADRTVSFGKQVKDMKRMLVGASSDENRARKQVIKLQLILNEVRLNTINKQLPSISDQFTQDLAIGEDKIARVRRILEHSPLDVQALNKELQDAIDFIYKLYNNANNLVGVAVMVENAIVFGNRFRSTYPQLDSDLTRAEVCYQNGEYTRALKIAIQAIENLHPGIYEKLVSEKNPAVMNLAG